MLLSMLFSCFLQELRSDSTQLLYRALNKNVTQPEMYSSYNTCQFNTTQNIPEQLIHSDESLPCMPSSTEGY